MSHSERERPRACHAQHGAQRRCPPRYPIPLTSVFRLQHFPPRLSVAAGPSPRRILDVVKAATSRIPSIPSIAFARPT